MYRCKKIMLLLLVMSAVLVGMSGMVFASEYHEEDWRISENGAALTLYPARDLSLTVLS